MFAKLFLRALNFLRPLYEAPTFTRVFNHSDSLHRSCLLGTTTGRIFIALFLLLALRFCVCEGERGGFSWVLTMHRKRIKTKEKAKVVASVWGEIIYSIPCSLDVLPRIILKNRMKSSISFKSSWCNSSFNLNRTVQIS